MYLYDYKPPLATELKRLGYNLPFEPNEQDILLMKMIFHDPYSDLQADIVNLNQWQIRDCVKSAIRIYAYYLNNPSQFLQDPHNIIPASFRNAFNTALSFLLHAYKHRPNHQVRVKNKLVKRYQEQAITVWFNSAKALANRIKYNTLLEQDLNIKDRVNIDLFR